MRLGAIADDFTGAPGIAGFLVCNGLRTAQLNGIPPTALALEVDTVVVSLKSKPCPAAQAVAASLEALDRLRARGCPQFFKYCSTFDGTPRGNISPLNGRTVRDGHLYVNGAPLDEFSWKSGGGDEARHRRVRTCGGPGADLGRPG